jgi:tRNA (guanine-N7-)-methyltransferase
MSTPVVPSPPEARALWRAVFGNDHPVEVEIGPGHGEVLLAYAAAAPATNFFAIERSAGAAEAVGAKAARRGLHNVRVIAADARCVLAHLVADASVAAYHIYFPDPWPKTRHRTRRLASRPFARDLARTLLPGGILHLASDLLAVVDDFAAHLARAGLVRETGAMPPAARPTTAFERKYAGAGTHCVCFVRPRRGDEDGAPAPVRADE